MKILPYSIIQFNEEILIRELLTAFPEWRIENPNGIVIEYFGMYYDIDHQILWMYVPDNTNETTLLSVINAHDPSAAIYNPISWSEVIQARNNFMGLPNWAIWTSQEASNFVISDIVSGMTKTQLEAWIDTNVVSLATAKDALKLIGDELIDLRTICANMAKMLIYLRDVTIRR